MFASIYSTCAVSARGRALSFVILLAWGMVSLATPAQAASPTAQCDCGATRLACQDFPSWSAAQACFNQCRIETGLGPRGLDADGDGVVCELGLKAPSPGRARALIVMTPAVEAGPQVTTTEPVTMIRQPPAAQEIPAAAPTAQPAGRLGEQESTVEPAGAAPLWWGGTGLGVLALGGGLAWLSGRRPSSGPPRR